MILTKGTGKIRAFKNQNDIYFINLSFSFWCFENIALIHILSQLALRLYFQFNACVYVYTKARLSIAAPKLSCDQNVIFRRIYTASSRFSQTVAYSLRLNGSSAMKIRDHYFLLFLAGIMKLFFVTPSLSVTTECYSQWQQQAQTEQYQTCHS